MLYLNSTVDEQFTAFANEVLEGGILSERERAVAILATVFTLEDSSAVKDAIINAKQAGLTNEEIGNVSALVIAMRGQRINRLGAVEMINTSVKAGCCS